MRIVPQIQIDFEALSYQKKNIVPQPLQQRQHRK